MKILQAIVEDVDSEFKKDVRYVVSTQIMDYESVRGYTLRIYKGDECIERKKLDTKIVGDFIDYILGEG